ncbi:helix-turn-helix domain-containing protein [Endothiovibrio diazotrophicus]
MDKETIHPLQLHIAERVKAVRMECGIKPGPAADLIGVSETHLRRQERGESRFSVTQLYLLARACNVPVSYFFTTYESPPDEARRIHDVLLRQPMEWDPAPREEKEAALMALWRALPSESHRNRLLNLLEVLVYAKTG